MRISDWSSDVCSSDLRSRDSQLGAWASDQSRPLDNRHTFEARFEEVQARFEGQEVPRPPHWSGFRVIPERIEFWQDREHRLHERRLFVREGNGWTESLLSPRSAEHTSELQSLMRISYAVFCLKKTKQCQYYSTDA